MKLIAENYLSPVILTHQAALVNEPPIFLSWSSLDFCAQEMQVLSPHHGQLQSTNFSLDRSRAALEGRITRGGVSLNVGWAEFIVLTDEVYRPSQSGERRNPAIQNQTFDSRYSKHAVAGWLSPSQSPMRTRNAPATRCGPKETGRLGEDGDLSAETQPALGKLQSRIEAASN